MSLLTGPEIVKQVELGNIVIDPFDPARTSANSYDLALGPILRVYPHRELDMRREHTLEDVEIPENGIVLEPSKLYLGMTVEKAGSSHYAPMLSGRSSAARLGIFPHIVAGFGDVGFCDRWTLEIVVVKPVRVYAGVRLVQIYFETVQGEIRLYSGKYQKQDGPTGSRFFEELAPPDFVWVTHEWLAKEWRINPDGDSFFFDKGWLRETAVGSGTFQHQNKPGMAPLDEVRHGSKAGQIWKRPV